MKKLLVLIVIVTLLSVTYPEKKLEDIGGGGCISFYVNDEIFIEGAETVQNGIGFIIKAPLSKAQLIRKQIPEISGESVLLTGDADTVSGILKTFSAIKVSESLIENTLFINAYSKNIRGYVVSEGEKINLQIAYYGDGRIVVGIPLILGGC